MPSRQVATVALLATVLMGGTGAIAGGFGPLDPSKVRWSRADYRASKLAVTAISEVRIDTELAATAANHWLVPATGRPVTPRGSDVVRIHLRANVLGKRSNLDLWVDPFSGAAIQRTQLETGKKVRHHRHRSLRFTERGVFNSTYRATEETVDQPFEQWTLSEALEPFPGELARGAVVTEPSALFYLLAVVDLDQVGSAFTTNVFSKGRVMRVRLTARGLEEIKVDYTEMSDGSQRQVQGRVEAVRVSLEGTAIEEGGESRDFEFLGLRGDVEVFLEPARRIPLQISGNIRYAGRSHVRLQRVELR